MCPACIAATATLIASAVSSGGAAAVVVNKLRAKQIARRMLRRPTKRENTWQQRMSK